MKAINLLVFVALVVLSVGCGRKPTVGESLSQATLSIDGVVHEDGSPAAGRLVVHAGYHTYFLGGRTATLEESLDTYIMAVCLKYRITAVRVDGRLPRAIQALVINKCPKVADLSVTDPREYLDRYSVEEFDMFYDWRDTPASSAGRPVPKLPDME